MARQTPPPISIPTPAAGCPYPTGTGLMHRRCKHTILSPILLAGLSRDCADRAAFDSIAPPYRTGCGR